MSGEFLPLDRGGIITRGILVSIVFIRMGCAENVYYCGRTTPVAIDNS